MAIARSIDEIVALIPAPRPGIRSIVGIAGAPGAGKSTIAAEIVAAMPTATLLPMDGFHLPQAELRRLGRRDRMGAPDTFDVDGFVSTLTALVGNSGATVTAPAFDRESEEPVPDGVTLSPEFPTVVVEGNYLLLETEGWGRVAPLLDVTFQVRLADRIRHARLIARHERFGKSAPDAVAWVHGPDEANARLIEAVAHRADHIIDLG